MPENKSLSEACCKNDCKDSVCVDVNKIFDSCKDKDCLEDLRIFPTQSGKELIDKAINIKARSAEIIWVYIDVEAVPFNRGFFTIDIKFFFKVKFDAFLGVGKPCEFEGLATFDKRVILFGSEGSAKIFSSKYVPDGNDEQLQLKTNLPKAVVEVVDPIILSTRVCEKRECGCCNDACECPSHVRGCFEEDLCHSCDDDKILFVTLGLFSVIRLERNVQLLIPAFDFCIPEKECVTTTDDPCSLFKKINFPQDEFYPPSVCEFFDKDKKCCC